MYVHYLTVSASSEVIGGSVLKLIATLLPSYLSILLPISLFLSILWVYGKLFADNELLVIFACGMTWRRLLKITTLPAFLIMLVVGACSLYLVPTMNVYQQNLSSQASAYKSNLSLIKPGRIFSTSGGKQVIYIGQSDVQKGTISNLFIYRNVNNVPEIIVAPSGYQKIDKTTGATYIVLTDGHEYKGQLGQQDYQIVKFGDFAQRITNPVVVQQSESIDASNKTTWQLFQQPQPEDWAELQWRFSAPISVLVLAALAVAICYVPPRHGRFSKLFPAILLFIIYFNLLSASRSWLQQGSLSPWIGLWWVHIVFLILALGLIRWRDGRKHQIAEVIA
jgi:lipopolysaccharide export system permease protein